MFEYKCELYLNGRWQSYDIYNQLRFDERKDGQVPTALCYIRTEQKTRFEPMRKARITMSDESDNSSKVKYYFAYFKGQQRQKAGYWLHEVMLIDPAKRAQGELINGLRVIQNDSNSITLYDTFVRLCNTTPLRLVSQSNLYNPTTDTAIVNLMKSIRSPEYAWSCRTLFWECLKEIGMDMGGYFPTVEFGDNGQYIISFFPTERKGNEITDFDCISLANGYDESQVCSEIDTDISNIIATNQGTASVVFPSQVGWITPRTDGIQLTDKNCEIHTSSAIAKPIHIWLNIEGVTVDVNEGGMVSKNISELIGSNALDLAYYIPEYNEFSSLPVYIQAEWLQLTEPQRAEKSKNNTFYWLENSNRIVLNNEYSQSDLFADISVLARVAFYSFVHNCKGVYKSTSSGVSNCWYITDYQGKEWELWPGANISDTQLPIDMRPRQFRVEYISQSTSTKIRAVKQNKCGYEYVTPYNQRAEVVDAEMLGAELDKTVNQLGVDYIKAVSVYRSLADVLPLDTVYKEGNDSYMLVCNEYEATNKTNIRVTHTFSKNWSMLSSWLKQNKQYRNTRIPTDILARNLHYQDYFVISETDGAAAVLGEKGLLTLQGVDCVADVFDGGRPNENTEVNNFALYYDFDVEDGIADHAYGSIISCDSFGVKKSIVLSAKFENNLTAGRKVDPDNDYYCQEVLYTNEDGELNTDVALIQFGIMDKNIRPNMLPRSVYYQVVTVPVESNMITTPVVDAQFYVDKSSAEQIAMTYQVHFVSDMSDIVIGGLMANNSPLVQDRTSELKYQLWGLTKPLANMAVIVNEENGVKVAEPTAANRNNYWYAQAGRNSDETAINFKLTLTLADKMPGNYIGWAITDENGRLYIARNSHPNEDQYLFFNHLHKYHEQD
nr:MAG TPA: hypothetical protein [Caudoviricetes sp.]